MIGFGSSVATTPGALREMLKAAYAEEEAAGDHATCLSIGCLLTWMDFHRNVPHEETSTYTRTRNRSESAISLAC